jgi:hypothetical protein
LPGCSQVVQVDPRCLNRPFEASGDLSGAQRRVQLQTITPKILAGSASSGHSAEARRLPKPRVGSSSLSRATSSRVQIARSTRPDHLPSPSACALRVPLGCPTANLHVPMYDRSHRRTWRRRARSRRTPDRPPRAWPQALPRVFYLGVGVAFFGIENLVFRLLWPYHTADPLPVFLVYMVLNGLVLFGILGGVTVMTLAGRWFRRRRRARRSPSPN